MLEKKEKDQVLEILNLEYTNALSQGSYIRDLAFGTADVFKDDPDVRKIVQELYIPHNLGITLYDLRYAKISTEKMPASRKPIKHIQQERENCSVIAAQMALAYQFDLSQSDVQSFDYLPDGAPPLLIEAFLQMNFGHKLNIHKERTFDEQSIINLLSDNWSLIFPVRGVTNLYEIRDTNPNGIKHALTIANFGIENDTVFFWMHDPNLSIGPVKVHPMHVMRYSSTPLIGIKAKS